MKTEFEGKQYTMTKDGDKIVLTPVEPPKPARLEFPTGGVTVDSAGDQVRATAEQVDTGHCFRTAPAAQIAAERRLSCMRQIQVGLEADPGAGGFIKHVRCYSVYFNAQDNKWHRRYTSVTASYPIYVHTEAQAEAACELLNREGVKP